jgi:hypothetical protein
MLHLLVRDVRLPVALFLSMSGSKTPIRIANVIRAPRPESGEPKNAQRIRGRHANTRSLGTHVARNSR